MKNIVYCKNCKKEIIVGKNYADRVLLSKEIGKEFNKTCPYYKKTYKYNINNVYAKSNFLINIFVLLFALISSIFLVIYILY